MMFFFEELLFYTLCYYFLPPILSQNFFPRRTSPLTPFLHILLTFLPVFLHPTTILPPLMYLPSFSSPPPPSPSLHLHHATTSIVFSPSIPPSSTSLSKIQSNLQHSMDQIISYCGKRRISINENKSFELIFRKHSRKSTAEETVTIIVCHPPPPPPYHSKVQSGSSVLPLTNNSHSKST